MEKEQLEEKQAIAGLRADRIRQLKETEGWKQLEEWINKELISLEKLAMNPGFENETSYIIAKGKYQGLESVLLYVNNAIKIIKIKDEQ